MTPQKTSKATHEELRLEHELLKNRIAVMENNIQFAEHLQKKAELAFGLASEELETSDYFTAQELRMSENAVFKKYGDYPLTARNRKSSVWAHSSFPMKQPRLTILNFHKTFPDNETCLRFLFNARFPNPKCAKCEGTKFYKHPTRACFTCAKGCTHLWPKEGTIFDHSSTDLVKWFFAIFLMSQSRNGVAAKELERALGVTYKCAFRIGHQVRKLMKDNAFTLFGEVEADETAVGGKRKGKRGRGADGKTIVFGTLQRKGMMNAAVVENVKAVTLMPHMQDNIAKGSKLMTDELKSYKKIARLLDMEHDTVNHGAKQYAKGETHTNTIEGFWSQLKRSLDGTHHVISPKMLHAYVSEFQWRYNNRQSVTHLFDLLLSRVSSQQGSAA